MTDESSTVLNNLRTAHYEDWGLDLSSQEVHELWADIEAKEIILSCIQILSSQEVHELRAKDKDKPESPNDTQKETFVYGKDSKPLPCPFCGEIVKECNDVATPIDAALRKRIAKLEAERLELRNILEWVYVRNEYKDKPEERER